MILLSGEETGSPAALAILIMLTTNPSPSPRGPEVTSYLPSSLSKRLWWFFHHQLERNKKQTWMTVPMSSSPLPQERAESCHYDSLSDASSGLTVSAAILKISLERSIVMPKCKRLTRHQCSYPSIYTLFMYLAVKMSVHLINSHSLSPSPLFLSHLFSLSILWVLNSS
jgi:hypothetical protein